MLRRRRRRRRKRKRKSKRKRKRTRPDVHGIQCSENVSKRRRFGATGGPTDGRTDGRTDAPSSTEALRIVSPEKLCVFSIGFELRFLIGVKKLICILR